MHHLLPYNGPMICSWITDESKNQYCFGDTMEHGLYYALEPDRQGKHYFLTVRNGCSCTWLSEEDAQAILDRQKPISGNCDIQLSEVIHHVV